MLGAGVPSEHFSTPTRNTTKVGTGLWVEANVWTTQKRIETPSLFYDADTTHSVVCRANELKS